MLLAKSLVVIAMTVVTVWAVEPQQAKPNFNETHLSVQDICSLLPPNKYILRPNTCDHWVKCPSGADTTDFEEGACVAGLFYDKNEGRCNYEDNVQCPYTVVKKNRCEDHMDDVFLADSTSDNCRGYVYCKSGKELRATCPTGLVFDPKQSACVYALEYKCPSLEKKPSTSPICRSIGNHQFFADEEDCSKYHECDEEALLTHECGEDMAFHYTLGRCTPKDNAVCHPKAKKPLPDSKICGVDGNARTGYLPDGQSCSGYYICAKKADNKADRYPVHMKCQSGYFFDEEKWSCRDRLNVHCALDRCEGMNNKYVNVAGDCSSYARCNNDTTVATGRCPTSYYFDERTQGCTPQIINYIACSAQQVAQQAA